MEILKSSTLWLMICIGLGLFLQTACAQKSYLTTDTAGVIADSSRYFANPIGKGAKKCLEQYVCLGARTSSYWQSLVYLLYRW